MKFTKIIFICLILTFLDFAIAGPIKVLAPDKDAFYKPPSGYEKEDPGRILKIRKTPQPLRSVLIPIHIKNSWQALVRSTGSDGNATAIVTTIMEPFNADPTKVLSYQTFEDASNLSCAPSYAMLYGAPLLPTISTQAEMYFMQVALDKGWYVVSPDYEGPRSSLGDGVLAGQATLDSIRAVLKSSNVTGIDKDAKVALWGYSGGTIATGWAAALQPTYAKELKRHLLGACMGGFVTNITATAVGVDGTLFAGLIANAVIGIVNENKLDKLMDTLIVPARVATYNAAKSLCLCPSIIHYAYDRFFSGPRKMINIGWEFFQVPVIKKILDKNILGLHKGDPMPEIPIFVYHGQRDTLVPYKLAEKIYHEWCDWGIQSYEYAVAVTTGHITEAIDGAPAAIAWLTKIFDGNATVKGCQRTVRETNLLYPGSSRSIADFLRGIAKDLLGKDFGPNGEDITISPKMKREYGYEISREISPNQFN